MLGVTIVRCENDMARHNSSNDVNLAKGEK
jgi:hypothetical protein